MSKFLNNNVCKFEILQNENLLMDTTDGVNLFVGVFFKRDQYYKNFQTYVKGLSKLLKFVDDEKSNPPGKDQFIYVLFIDQNIVDDAEIMKIIDSCKLCVPVLFKCSKYMVGSYHADLFGSLVRFFPMFDFPNNPTKIIICTDIDLHAEDYVRLESLIKNKPNGIVAAGDITRVLLSHLTPYVYSNLISYNRKKHNRKLILDFIENADKIESKGHYGKRLTPFGFGIDEIFINDALIPSIGEISFIIDYQISYFLFRSKSRIMDEPRVDTTSKILSIILGPYDDKNMTIAQKIDFIDKNTYQIREKTEINNEMCRRFTKVIEHLVESGKSWMERATLQFIYNYLRHIISANVIIQYEYKKGIIRADAYETVNDSEGASNNTEPDDLTSVVSESVNNVITETDEDVSSEFISNSASDTHINDLADPDDPSVTAA
jgi:hypothetical protein